MLRSLILHDGKNSLAISMTRRSVFAFEVILCDANDHQEFLSISASVLLFSLRICLQELNIFSCSDLLRPDPWYLTDHRECPSFSNGHGEFFRFMVGLVKETISGESLWEGGAHTFSSC